MNLWQIIGAIAPLAVIFGFFTLIIHIYQTRILRRWKEESIEAQKRYEEYLRRHEDQSREDHKRHEDQSREDHKRHEEEFHDFKKYHEETIRYIASLIASEGQKTRTEIRDRF